jgi:tungstate transport system permease protein
MDRGTWRYWEDLRDGLTGALRLLLTGDPETWSVIRQSLLISLSASLLSLAVGLPVGTWLARSRFRGRRVLMTAFNTGFGLPPVVVGLLLSILLLRHGPLGALNLRFTPAAVILAQFLLSCPIIVGVTMAAIQQLNPKLTLQIQALGASHAQLVWLLWREARLSLLTAYMAAFGAIVSEVGASMMVGGNLPGSTRVMTTAIVMETGMGHYDRAIAYGVILLLLVASFVAGLTWIQQRAARG